MQSSLPIWDNKQYVDIWEQWEIIRWVLYKNCRVLTFEWVEYIVSKNAILTLQLTELCNAGCHFCFNGVTFYPSWTIDSTDQSFEKLLDFCKAAWVSSITFSGWEPTLEIWKLVEIVERASWQFKDFRIHTNGLNLFETIKERWVTVFDFLCSHWINKITLSLAHYEKEKNAELMKFRWKFKWLTISQLNHLWNTREWISSIRLSCFLNREWISNVDDMQKYIEFGKDANIKNFIFRSGWIMPRQFLKDTRYTKFGLNHSVSIDHYVEYFIRELGYKETFSLHKSDIHVHVLEKDWVKVDFEESSEEIDPDKKIRRINYFWNGVSYTSWIDPTQLLFEEDKGKLIDGILEDTQQRRRVWAFPAADIWRASQSRVISIIDNRSNFPVDLHTHTINSDGNYTYDKLLAICAKFWVKVLSITEHNFINAQEFRDARELWSTLWIDIPFPWVEINIVTTPDGESPDRKHHLLAYWDWLLDSQFQEIISLPNKLKNQYYAELVDEIVRKFGFQLPKFDDILKGVNTHGDYATPNKQLITRSVIARYIQGITWESTEEIKRKYLPEISSDISYRQYNRAEDIIPIIKELGGICWLAHPGWDRPFDWKWSNKPNLKYLLWEIWRLRSLWMDWIEIFHKSHSQETIDVLRRFSKEIMLINIGGSDYHWTPKRSPEHKDINPGTLWLTMEEYEKIQFLLNK